MILGRLHSMELPAMFAACRKRARCHTDGVCCNCLGTHKLNCVILICGRITTKAKQRHTIHYVELQQWQLHIWFASVNIEHGRRNKFMKATETKAAQIFF